MTLKAVPVFSLPLCPFFLLLFVFPFLFCSRRFLPVLFLPEPVRKKSKRTTSQTQRRRSTERPMWRGCACLKLSRKAALHEPKLKQSQPFCADKNGACDRTKCFPNRRVLLDSLRNIFYTCFNIFLPKFRQKLRTKQAARRLREPRMKRECGENPQFSSLYCIWLIVFCYVTGDNVGKAKKRCRKP